MAENIRSGDFYKADIPESTKLKIEKLQEYCSQNDIFLSHIEPRYREGMFKVTEEVSFFTFLPFGDKKMFEEFNSAATAFEVKKLQSMYPKYKARLAEIFYSKVLNNMINNPSLLEEYIALYPQGSNVSELTEKATLQLIYLSKEEYLNRALPILKAINPTVMIKNDFMDIDYLSYLYETMKSDTTKLASRNLEKLIYRSLDFIPIVSKTIISQYERDEYEVTLKDNTTSSYQAFINRFPNSSFSSVSKQRIKELDKNAYNKGASMDNIQYLKDYISQYPKGDFVNSAKQKITDIERKEALALQQKKKSDIANELDDINKYIVYDAKYGVVKGNDLSFWQSIASYQNDISNINAFVHGFVWNQGKKTKKIKLNINLHVLHEVRVSALFVQSKETYKRYKKGSYYASLAPGEERQFIVLFDVEVSDGNHGSYLFGHGSSVYLDTDDPFDIEVERTEDISPDIIKKQGELLAEVKKNGNVKLVKTGWQSNYTYSTNIKPDAQSKEANVEVKKLTNNSVSNGFIHIYSENNESDSKKNYYSEIQNNRGSKIYSTNDPYDDNSTGPFRDDQFPLTIIVSYSTPKGKWVSQKTTLSEFNDYDVRVTAKY